jgi:hypothetical protein
MLCIIAPSENNFHTRSYYTQYRGVITMFSQPSLSGQPKPDANRNNVRKAVKTILILVFMVVIVILLSLAVILSGRTGINPMQTPSPAPTTTPTATQVSASSVIVVSVGLLQPHNPQARTGLRAEKNGSIGSAHEIVALPLNALQFNYLW